MSLACLSLTSKPPTRPLSGSLRMPGDRAIGHHALLLAALAIGESRITGLPRHGGVQHMVSALRALGAEATQETPEVWRVSGRGIGGLREPEDALDMGGSAVAARLMCGMLASHDLFAVLTGQDTLRRRPMRWMTDLLQDCGACFQCPARGWLPLAVQGARDALPIERHLSMPSASAKSALLLAGLNAPGWTRITEEVPTCDPAARMLRHFGASVTVEPFEGLCTTSVLGQPELRAADLTVPGDLSSAAYPLMAALIVPGSAVTVCGLPLDPLRTGLFAALRDMGARLEITRERLEGGWPVADVTARYTGLRGVEVQAVGMVDAYPILAVAAACAAGLTRMRGPARLLPDAVAMLRLAGVRVEDAGDGITVHGTGAAPAGGVRIAPGTDPRAALCGLILGLATAAPVRVDDAGGIETAWPGLLAQMCQLGAPFA